MRRLLQSSAQPDSDGIETLISECVGVQKQIASQRLAAVSRLPADRQLWAKEQSEERDVVDIADRQLAMLAATLIEFEARFRPRRPYVEKYPPATPGEVTEVRHEDDGASAGESASQIDQESESQ